MTVHEIVGLAIAYNLFGGSILFLIMLGDYRTWFHKIGSWAFVNPFVVYKFNTSVNWFGAFVIALLLSLICPIGAVCYWIYKLVWLFCKLCTVGRK